MNCRNLGEIKDMNRPFQKLKLHIQEVCVVYSPPDLRSHHTDERGHMCMHHLCPASVYMVLFAFVRTKDVPTSFN